MQTLAGDLMRPVALITGASAGLGRAFAHLLARDGYDLVLVARNEDALHSLAEELAARWKSKAHVIATDLTAPGTVDAIGAYLLHASLNIDVLINNAGVALCSSVANCEPAEEAALVTLQINVTLELTRTALPMMQKRGRGRIIIVSSFYAFVPAANQAVYGACKAFLASYTAALAEEVRHEGIVVTLLAPGRFRSMFHARAGRQFATGLSAEEVAEQGWRASSSGRFLVIPGIKDRFLLAALCLLPMAVRTRVMCAINARRGLDHRT